jgi:hypothetical protein
MTFVNSLAKRFVLAFALLLLAASGACAADGKAANDIAHFIAGMPPSADSPLAALTSNAAWKRHEAFFNERWKQFEDKNLSKVRAWSTENVKQSQAVLYYMFSGPDVLYADAFFPNAKTIIMSGLELSGPIPQTSGITSRALNRQLEGIRASLGNLLKHGYFITSQMGSQLSRSNLYGTLPVIYLFLARSGKTIHDVSLIALDTEGKVHPRDEKGLKSYAKGVKIVYAGNDGQERTLYYFKTDLSNKGVAASGYLKFCQEFGPGDSLVKSASYLLHNPGFSDVRAFLLKNAVTILQDDTGIPVKYLSQADWKLRPYGTYLRPIRQFRHANQPKLWELYRKERPAPLAFSVGYHWGRPSNLLIALKNTPAATEVK